MSTKRKRRKQQVFFNSQTTPTTIFITSVNWRILEGGGGSYVQLFFQITDICIWTFVRMESKGSYIRAWRKINTNTGIKRTSLTTTLISFSSCKAHLYTARPRGWIFAEICGGNSTPAVSVVPFRSNTFSPLKSQSSVRVKSGQVHIFQLHYLKRSGSSAK